MNFFKTEKECQIHIDKIQPEWRGSKLSVQKIIFQTTINQLYDCVGCVVTDGISFARAKKSQVIRRINFFYAKC